MPRRRPDGAPPPLPRPPAGSVEATLPPLRMPPVLREEARACAQREGCTEAEWWRRAGAERVLRQRARGR